MSSFILSFCSIWAETDKGCILAGNANGTKQKISIRVVSEAVEMFLVGGLKSGAAVDQHLQDQVCSAFSKWLTCVVMYFFALAYHLYGTGKRTFPLSFRPSDVAHENGDLYL